MPSASFDLDTAAAVVVAGLGRATPSRRARTHVLQQLLLLQHDAEGVMMKHEGPGGGLSMLLMPKKKRNTTTHKRRPAENNRAAF